MKIVKAHHGGQPSGQRTETFTGEVWFDSVLPPTDDTVVANVFFTPSARTFWHKHERGQLLHVISGFGRICTYGEEPQLLQVGDTVWVPPGEQHWHGGGFDTCMMHMAVSLGSVDWMHPVSDEEYGINLP